MSESPAPLGTSLPETPGTCPPGCKHDDTASLPETAQQDRLNRVKAFVTNLKQAEKPFSDGFVIDGVLAIIDDNIHLEVLDFSPPTERDIALAQKVAEKLGLGEKL